jgi:predicted enzyme related to lactoylglutathione lyase
MSTPENTDEECTMKPGKIGWAELCTSDPAAAIAYYTAMFGWETELFTAGDTPYTMFKLDGVPFGGVLQKPTPEMPTHWLNYVSVADLDAALAQSVSLGGETLFGPFPVPTVGRIAVVKDPQGAPIGFHEAEK